MSVTAHTRDQPFLPPESDVQLARRSRAVLAACLQAEQLPTLKLVAADGREQVVNLPSAALHVLLEALAQMAQGRAIAPLGRYANAALPIEDELTTQQAADLLNVSRPYLIRLLEAGTLPFRKVGTHRRIPAAALRDYKQAIDAKRYQVLDELTAQAQQLDMGYEYD